MSFPPSPSSLSTEEPGSSTNVPAGVGMGGSPSCASLRNKDFQEVTLEKEGRVLLHFAAAYGFRNIQNLVQKLKRGRCPYHYVEVMACPAGSCGVACSSKTARGPYQYQGRGSVPPGQEGWRKPGLLPHLGGRGAQDSRRWEAACHAPECRCPPITALTCLVSSRLLERRRPAQGPRHAQQGASPAG